MRAFAVFIFLALAACGNQPTDVTPQSGPPKEQDIARLDVSLRVTGDPALVGIGSPVYAIGIDNGPNKNLSTTVVSSFTVPSGFHLVLLRTTFPSGALQILLSGRPLPRPWCNPVPPLFVEDTFARGSTTSLTFVLDCPPLEGTATLHVHLIAKGDNAPERIQVYLLSQTGAHALTPVEVPANRDTSLSVTTGIYRVGIDAPGCQFRDGPYSGLTSGVYLRRDTEATVSLTLPCT